LYCTVRPNDVKDSTMNYEQIQRTVPTRASMNELAALLPSKLSGVRIDDVTDRGVTGRSGSKLLYRLFGAYVWPGTKNFPFRFAIAIDEADPSRAHVTVDSDLGPYVVSVPRSRQLFVETADALIDVVEAAASRT
jgi:hypothetical protein